jgi:hypothetical protein
VNPSTGDDSDGENTTDELDVAEQELLDEELNIRNNADDLESRDTPDAAKIDHDDETISTAKAQAIEQARAVGITMTAAAEKVALGLFPKVCQFLVSQDVRVTKLMELACSGCWPCSAIAR